MGPRRKPETTPVDFPPAWFLLRCLPDDVPATIRMRRALKCLLRSYGIKVEKMTGREPEGTAMQLYVWRITPFDFAAVASSEEQARLLLNEWALNDGRFYADDLADALEGEPVVHVGPKAFVFGG